MQKKRTKKAKRKAWLPIAAIIAIILIGIIIFAEARYLNKEQVITANVIEDLVNSQNQPTDFVFRFYQGKTPISDYIAIPRQYVMVDKDNQKAVGIFTDNSVNAIYYAKVVEDSALMKDPDTDNPPYLRPYIAEGVPCFKSDDQSKVVPCAGAAELDLDWSSYDLSGGVGPLATSTTDSGYYPVPVIHTGFSLPINIKGAIKYGYR